MLQKVCGSVGLVRLCATSGIDPHTHGRGLGPRGVLGSDLGKSVNWVPSRFWRAEHTVKPLLRVVDSVLEPWETGVARPLVKGDRLLALTALMAVFERRACCTFNARRREAIALMLALGRDGKKEGWWRRWRMSL